MKKQKVVIFDIDGVLADFEGAFCEAFGNKNRHLYSLLARYPEVDPDLIGEWINDEENYSNLNPIFGGITLLNQVKARGFKVYLATARPKHLTNVTLAWLKLYNVQFDQLTVGVKHKPELVNDLCNMFDVQMVVEDSVSILSSIYVPSNTKVVCLAWAQPWNDGYFPRAIYDEEKMKIMVNMGDNNWRWIWSKK